MIKKSKRTSITDPIRAYSINNITKNGVCLSLNLICSNSEIMFDFIDAKEKENDIEIEKIRYVRFLTQADLCSISPIFKDYNSMESILEDIYTLLSENKYEFILEDNRILVILYTHFGKNRQTIIQIPRESNEFNERMKNVYRVFKDIKKKLVVIEKENRNVKAFATQIKRLKEENAKLKKENELIRDSLRVFKKENFLKNVESLLKETDKIDQSIAKEWFVDKLEYLTQRMKVIEEEEKLKEKLNSNIIKCYADYETLISFLPKPPKNINKLYTATEDNGSAVAFHQKCKNQTCTLTIIKSSKGYIFGGYTEQNWSGNGEWKKDDKAFIFNLNKKSKTMSANKYSIYCYPRYGPTFGQGYAINISDGCTNNINSYTTIYDTYPNAQMQDNTNNYCENFRVDEYEVFKVNY